MQQLSAADSLFLGLETPECPMNMGLLIMLEGARTPHSIDHLMTALKVGALQVHRHHQRVIQTSFKLDYPYWINDGNLQVAKHIRHHKLPAPGNEAQLHAMAEKLLMQPLNREQPLWEFHLISGLENNKHALIFKLHHACADGLGALKMFAQTFAPTSGLEINWPIKESVTTRELRKLYLKRLITRPGNFTLGLLAAPLLKLYLLVHAQIKTNKTAPTSRFTGIVGRQRSYATLKFPIASFRRINRQFGSSENEVLMTLYSGALRKYLESKGELPDRSLHAGMPISMMFSSHRKNAANQAGFIRVTLGTKIPDPATRLELMKRRCAHALSKKPSKGWARLQAIGLNSPPQVITQAAQAYIKLLRLKQISPSFSAITTYMPGPARPLTIGDFLVDSIYPLSVIYHGSGLSISAMRYGKEINCGIAADRDMLPDPEAFKAYLQEEFDSLYQQACNSNT